MKPILFVDFSGTLCNDLHWRSLPAEKYQVAQHLLFESDGSLVEDWMRGKLTAEDVNQWLAGQLQMPEQILWELFVKDCRSVQISKAALHKIHSLREKHVTVLSTNNMDSFTRFTQPAHELEKYFDHISNSYYEGGLKTDPDGKIFLKYTQRYGVPIEACALIDDSKQIGTVFGSLGGKVLPVTPQTPTEHWLDILSG